MEQNIYLLVTLGIVSFLAFILIVRLVGAWMLRINEIITLQEKILNELKEINTKN